MNPRSASLSVTGYKLPSMSAFPSSASRRGFLRLAGTAAVSAAVARVIPTWAQTTHSGHVLPQAARSPAMATSARAHAIDLTIDRIKLPIGARMGLPVTVNGGLPAPLLRFRQGDHVELRVTNRLNERTSIHWHGILLPNDMDGVPGVTFKGIDPGETFVYRFPLKQYGTYWYHSHSGMQEQLGLYGPFVIDPAGPEPFAYDREHIVVLSDWTFDDPHWLLARLKKQPNFSNQQRQTVGELIDIAKEKGIRRMLSDWSAWSAMRMDPTDIADLTGARFTFLINGRPAATPWTGIFRPGERVRLRIINSAATTHYDVRIPGLKMTVVQADGQHVRPVEVEEFRMGAAETYDVLIEPKEDRAYAFFAETSDRSGYALAALAPDEGMVPPIPERRKRPLRAMADMGMPELGTGSGSPDAPSGMNHGAHGSESPAQKAPADGHAEHRDSTRSPTLTHGAHAGHGATATVSESQPDAVGAAHGGHAGDASSAPTAKPSGQGAEAHGTGGAAEGGGHGDMKMPPNEFGPGNSMMAMMPVSRAHEPGLGLGEDGWRVLTYRDLVAHDQRAMPEPQREIVLNVTGNMERFIWGFDGKKFSESEPVRLHYGERVRVTFINHTMMEHPLHLHGMFMEMENGAEGLPPLKHTIIVKPGEKMSVLVTADARGDWAFHCHLQYHMEAGMFRVFTVA